MSEIIGNLLILGITVTLFSSILFFVTNIPDPARATYTDMEPSLSNQIGNNIWVNVTHKGGQTLNDWTTGIYIFVNGAYLGELYISDNQGTNDIGDKWETGETWCRLVSFTPPLNSLSMLIVDKDTNSIVWQSDLLGGVTDIQLPPIIADRYTSPSPGMENETLFVYVRVIDPNDDEIIDVHLDLTTLGLTSNLTMSKGTNREWYVEMPVKADFNWDNRRITIHATDETGLHSSALMALDIIPESGGGGGGGGGQGWPPGNLDYSGLQGFAIFEWQDWEDNRFDAQPRTYFNWSSEDAVIVVASKYVVNANSQNTINVLNQTTKVVQSAVSSPNNEFLQYDFISGYYIYNCTIDTSKLPMAPSYYSILAIIADTWTPSNIFTMNARIYVAYPPGEPAGYPKILTYSDSSYSPAKLTKYFSTSDPSNNKVYVEITNLYGGAWVPNSGNVEIRDFFWNAQIKRTPLYVAGATSAVAWNGPVSNLWQVSSSPGVYRFVINLANATEGWPWIGGNNAYILRFDTFKAGPETYLLNRLIYVNAPETKMDIVAGLPSAFGSAWGTQASVFYYRNDNSWTPPDLLETTASKDTYNPVVVMLRAGDINDDARGDFVALMGYGVNPTNINAFYPTIYYSLPGGGWAKTVLPALPGISGDPTKQNFNMALGNIDQDDDLDLVMTYGGSTASVGVYVYRNDGAWTRSTVVTTANVNQMRLADMDPVGASGNDPTRSFDIVLSRTDGSLTIYRNQLGDGTTWVADSLSTTGTATVKDFAIGETAVTGTVTNTYLQTQNPFQDAGVYEAIAESKTYRYTTTYPITEGSTDNVTDSLYQLNPGSAERINDPTDYFTVARGNIVNITGWDGTQLYATPDLLSATFKARYSTEAGYDGTQTVQWFNTATGTWVNMGFSIVDTGGAFVEVQYDLTPITSNANNLKDLWVRFVNTGTGALVDFDYWRIEVTWVIGDAAEHIYQFSVTPGMSHQFNAYVAVNNTIDADTFRFQYSTDGVTWTTMFTATYTAPLYSFQLYQYNLPAAISGTVYVKVLDTNRAISSTPSPDWVRVGQMYIATSATSTVLGTKIQAIDVADVDGNGSNDIVVSSMTASGVGQIWVLYNKIYYEADGMGGVVPKSGIFRSENIKKVLENSLVGSKDNSVSWIEADAFFSPYMKGYMDIVIWVVGKSSSTLYGIEQNGLGTFGGLTAMNFPASYKQGSTFIVNKMIAADVDGNGRCDLVFGTSDGRIIIWMNYGGTLTATGWQSYLVDILGEPIKDLSVACYTI